MAWPVSSVCGSMCFCGLYVTCIRLFISCWRRRSASSMASICSLVSLDRLNSVSMPLAARNSRIHSGILPVTLQTSSVGFRLLYLFTRFLAIWARSKLSEFGGKGLQFLLQLLNF